MNIGTLSQMLLIQSPINKHLYKHRSVTNIIILKADLTKFKRLMELYQTYQKQANSNERTIYSLHDDSGSGDKEVK